MAMASNIDEVLRTSAREHETEQRNLAIAIAASIAEDETKRKEHLDERQRRLDFRELEVLRREAALREKTLKEDLDEKQRCLDRRELDVQRREAALRLKELGLEMREREVDRRQRIWDDYLDRKEMERRDVELARLLSQEEQKRMDSWKRWRERNSAKLRG